MGKHNNHQLTKELIPQCLKNLPDLESNCATIPHAGGKIVISMQPLTPNVPIIEIRGKYMLSSQFRQQQAISPTGSGIRNHQYNKKPGPFIFFYRLPNDDEICIDTRTYGNDARFVRRSCRPNSEVLHSIEKGTIHLYIVSLTQIANGTEITIKHEPHDLAMIARGTTIVPTSTICACGCPKDCVFSLPPPTPPTTPLPFTTTTKSKKVNGHLLDDSGHPVRRTKNMNSRGRSTSSSGDSSLGMLSPNTTQMVQMPTLIASPGIQTMPTAALLSPMGQQSNHPILNSNSPISLSIASPQQLPPPSPQPLASPVPLVAIAPAPMVIVPELMAVVHTSPMVYERLKETTHSPVRPQTLDILPTTTEMLPYQQHPQVERMIQQQLIMSPPQNPPLSSPAPVITPVELRMSPQVAANQTKLPSPQKNNASPYKKTPLKGRAITFSEEPTTPTSIMMMSSSPTKLSPLAPHAPPPSMTQIVAATVAATPVSDVDQPDGVILYSPQPLQHQSSVVSITSVPSLPPTPTPSGDETTAPPLVISGPAGAPVSVASSRSTTTTREPKDKEKDNSPKLTREERKMQAIMKAFEKMEKNQERKQQQKQNKTGSSSTTTTTTSTVSSTATKRRNSSPSSPGGGLLGLSGKRSGKDDEHGEKSYNPRKKKRKGSKSYQHMNTSQKKVRRRSRMNSGDSDLLTSEESTPLLSPPLPLNHTHNGNLLNHHHHNHLGFTSADTTKTNDSSVNSAAGLLLALSHSQQLDTGSQSSVGGSVLPPQHMTTGTPPHVSSTCLLIEAACAPLEQTTTTTTITTPDIEVKYKGKTKKSIMNDWLNQEADIVEQKLLLEQQQQKAELKSHIHLQQQHQQQQQVNNEQAFDNLMHEAVSLCHFNNATYTATTINQQDEPENLTMVTKKVEDFIYHNDLHHHQEHTSSSSVATDLDIKWPTIQTTSASLNYTSYPDGSGGSTAMQFATPTNCSGSGGMSSGGSAAKKRWLRQAISEECNDDITSPPNGFMTPLKKRRVIRECSESTNTSVDELASPLTSSHPTFGHNFSAENSNFNFLVTKTPSDDDILSHVKDELTTVEDIKFEVKPEEKVEVKHFVDVPEPPAAPPPTVIVEDVKVKVELEMEEDETHYDETPTTLEQQSEDFVEPQPTPCVVAEPDDEIDIVNSPPSGEQIIAEDNLVKIEPEDDDVPDMKIDVEDNSLVPEEEPFVHMVDIETPVKVETIDEQQSTEDDNDPPSSDEVSIGVEVKQEIDDLNQDSSLQTEIIEGGESPIKVEAEIMRTEETIETKPILIERQPELSPQIDAIKSESDPVVLEESPTVLEAVRPITPVATPIVAVKPEVKITAIKIEEDTGVSEALDSNEDEIADIQKRLHSFHTENLFILKSRNKKTKPLLVKIEQQKRAGSPLSPPSSAQVTTPTSTKSAKKSSVHLNFDLNVEADSETVSVKLKEERVDDVIGTPSLPPQPSIVASLKDEKKEERHTRWDKPDESRFNLGVTIIPETPGPVVGTTIYPMSYMTTSSSTNPGYSTVVEPPTIHIPPNTPASHLQYYNAFYNKFTATTVASNVGGTINPSSADENIATLKSKYPSFSLLGDYLEAGSGVASAPGTIMGGVTKSSSFGGGSTLLDTQQPTSYYSVGATAGATTSLISNFLNKSYSTVGGVTSAALAGTSIADQQLGVVGGGIALMASGSLPNVLQAPSLIPTPQKILTRTQSADPRLNPNLNTPEPPPAPKRKVNYQ